MSTTSFSYYFAGTAVASSSLSDCKIAVSALWLSAGVFGDNVPAEESIEY
jgi:hypothetical protein